MAKRDSEEMTAAPVRCPERCSDITEDSALTCRERAYR